MRLGGEIVNLVRLHGFDHVPQAGTVGHVAVVEIEACVLLVWIGVDRIQPVSVKGGRAPDDAVDLIFLGQEEFRQKGAVLAGYAGDESFFHCFGTGEAHGLVFHR